MKKYIKLIVADILIAVIAVILYSPGLLRLRISDYSIFRAGMSVIAGVALICIFFFINITILKGPKRIPATLETVFDIEKAKAILKQHVGGKCFGSTAKTVISQLERIDKCQKRLADIIGQKFTQGTMSWEKFYAVVQEAESSAIKNVVTMANRMTLFDEEEYARLQRYKEDDIPDDIQEEQIKLYQENFDCVKSVITLNEKILLKLDALALELSTSEISENEEVNSNLLGEIERLIEETKYYQ